MLKIIDTTEKKTIGYVQDATRPSYDLNRGQEGSPRSIATEPHGPITYTWSRGFAVIRLDGTVIGMASERGGVYGCTLKIGAEKIEKTGIDYDETHCGLERLKLFVSLWVSSVTVGAERSAAE